MLKNNAPINRIFSSEPLVNMNMGRVAQRSVLGKIYLQQIKESYNNDYVIRSLSRIQDKDRVTTLGRGYGTLYDYSVF